MSGILVFAGSIRRESLNRRLALAAANALEEAGADVTLLDLADYELPLYNGDVEAEEGIPENAVRLKEVFVRHTGLLIASPEYNSSITPLLKNSIDWLSRRSEDEPPLVAFKGKIAGLVSASPGALGGLRGLVHVRSILGNIGVWVCPTQVAVGGAGNDLEPDGTVTDEGVAKRLAKLAGELTEAVRLREPDE